MSLLALLAVSLSAAPLEVTGCPEALRSMVLDEYALASLPSSSTHQVAVRCEGVAVEVSIDQPNVGNRTHTLQRGTDARAEVRVAVQVVELVRAALAEERFARAPLRPVSLEPSMAPQPPRPPRWSVSLAGGLTVAPGGLGGEPSVSAGVWRGVGAIELGVTALATVRATRLPVAAGRALLGLVHLEARAGYPLEFDSWTLTPHVGLGALVVWALGEPATVGWTGNLGFAPTFALGAGLSAWRALTSWLKVGLVTEVIAAPFPVRVELPGARATVGLPVLVLSLAFGFR